MLRLWLAHAPHARSITANVSSHPNSPAVAFSPAPSSKRSGGDYPLLATRYTLQLISYFRSGWAFLIPYLAAYLLYAWLRWPVNPATDLLSTVTPATGLPTSVYRPPCLLHVYWFLHALHLMLGAIALRAWWRSTSSERIAKGLEQDPDHETVASGLQSPVSRAVFSALPWLCLGLIFWLPGLYLEWPSDPWEHLRRINEWHILDEVMAHSAWKKSSYFLPYSLTGHLTGISQLSWLNVYYTTVCLLLSWQYYRLARACGLGNRASLVFVILQALLFGNNIFSFYRYYGLSSSVFAQIGAVALTRIALEVAKSPKQSLRSFFSLPFIGSRASSVDSPPTVYRLLLAGSLLLALTAFNHPQGVGFAALGITAVVVWRLIEWRRSTVGWLALAAAGLSVATILWFPRHSTLDEICLPQGWMNAWYGFNLLSPGSPAFDRSWQILGISGMVNIAIGAGLLRRNHVVGWLTIMPVLALIMPWFAVPFAHALMLQGGGENIVTFHRMLLAVPTGLALITAVHLWMRETARLGGNGPASGTTPGQQPYRWTIRSPYALPQVRYLSIAGGLLLALALISVEALSHHRFWQSLQVVPGDLQLRSLVPDSTPVTRAQNPDEDTMMIDIQLGTEVQEAFLPKLLGYISRQSPTRLDDKKLRQRLEWLAAMQPAISWVRAEGGGNGIPRFVPDHTRAGHDHPALRARIVAHPTATDAAWLVFGGHPPDRVLSNGQLALASPVGYATETFNPELIPVSRERRYRLSSTIRQVGAPEAVNYLAVAWYDQSGTLLRSNDSPPDGAGEPPGWSNGTYSYYGLRGQSAPPEPTNYEISFGLGEAAAIPGNAAFVRVGALLNYRSTPETMAELSHVTLAEKPIQSQLQFRAPQFRQLYSPASQAAQLSGHWSAQHVPAAQAGTVELHAGLNRLIKR